MPSIPIQAAIVCRLWAPFKFRGGTSTEDITLPLRFMLFVGWYIFFSSIFHFIILEFLCSHDDFGQHLFTIFQSYSCKLNMRQKLLQTRSLAHRCMKEDSVTSSVRSWKEERKSPQERLHYEEKGEMVRPQGDERYQARNEQALVGTQCPPASLFRQG